VSRQHSSVTYNYVLVGNNAIQSHVIARKGILHKNTAAHKKSALALKLKANA
jgi:ribosomal protein S20